MLSHQTSQTNRRRTPALVLDDLLTMDESALAALYASASVPSMTAVRGALRGRMLAVRGLTPMLAGPVRRWASSSRFPWRGKTFRPEGDDRGRGINRVVSDRFELYPFVTFIGKSHAGDFDALHLDYDLPDNPFFIRPIRDEIRELRSGLWLGQAYLALGSGTHLALYFRAYERRHRMSREEVVAGAVVTGAGAGIGQALALELAAGGVPLVLADIDRESTELTAQRTRARGVETTVVVCDVTSRDQVEALARRAEVTLPFVDLVCNNAGVLVLGELAALSEEDYRRVFDVNVWGVIRGTHAFLPGMLARGRGTIVNTASLAGTMGLPRMGAYNATKAAVISLSQTLAAELAGSGVTVTALCPSITASGFVAAADGPAGEETAKVGRWLLGNLGATPRRVARVGLNAAESGEPYAVPTIHGRAAWRLARLAPAAVTRGFGRLARLMPG